MGELERKKKEAWGGKEIVNRDLRFPAHGKL